jgi:hypothetical protein
MDAYPKENTSKPTSAKFQTLKLKSFFKTRAWREEQIKPALLEYYYYLIKDGFISGAKKMRFVSENKFTYKARSCIFQDS